MNPDKTTSVFLQHGSSRGPIDLRRTPRFLRFVLTGTNWETLDALDQLDDTPADTETVIVAELVSRGHLHIDGADKRGWRTAEWFKTATYKMVDNPPPRAVAVSTVQWRVWCFDRAKNPPAYTPLQPRESK